MLIPLAARPASIIGFHGTRTENVASILKYGFRNSKGPQQYLGDGCYFFDSLEYAKENCPKYAWLKQHPLSFFQAVIIYGRLFELTESSAKSLREFKEKLEQRHDFARFLEKSGVSELTLAVVINEFCKFYKETNKHEIDTVKVTYPKRLDKTPVWPGAPITLTATVISETIICVRPHARYGNIRNIELAEPK
jgi:hypothetical protein